MEIDPSALDREHRGFSTIRAQNVLMHPPLRAVRRQTRATDVYDQGISEEDLSPIANLFAHHHGAETQPFELGLIETMRGQKAEAGMGGVLAESGVPHVPVPVQIAPSHLKVALEIRALAHPLLLWTYFFPSRSLDVAARVRCGGPAAAHPVRHTPSHAPPAP
ncbi:MAG: hypothetical protein M3409_10240, partial [Gemmatimonadota bacterium]|nr:hypothetical protein [Gemmatimonadota bacterium]